MEKAIFQSGKNQFPEWKIMGTDYQAINHFYS